MKTYIQIILLFSSLSLLSIGGGNSVLPEMHLKVVGTKAGVTPEKGYHWLTNKQFADVFAISQAAPGPSILIVTLIGYAAGLSVGGLTGGIIGGVLATIAMMIPAGILVYLVTCFWQRAEKSPVRKAIEKGFAPLTVGLVLASAYIMSKAADHDWRGYLLTGICSVIFIFTRTNPLVVVGVAGVIGYLGWVGS